MNKRIENIRKFCLLFFIVNPFLIRLNWITQIEIYILTFIQISAFILSMTPEIKTKSNFLDKPNRSNRKTNFRTLRLIGFLSSFIFSLIFIGKIFDSRVLKDRKLSLESGLTYVEYVNEWSDSYYTISKYNILSQDTIIETIWSDNYTDVNTAFDEIK